MIYFSKIIDCKTVDLEILGNEIEKERRVIDTKRKGERKNMYSYFYLFIYLFHSKIIEKKRWN
jgi:hypothetical protein